MDVETKPKGLRLKRWQEKQLWIWRISQRSEAGKLAYKNYYQALKKTRSMAGLSKTAKKKRQKKLASSLSRIYETQISYLKHCRQMQRLVKRGQLRSGKFYCRGGKEINQERINRYEAACHFLVRKKIPGMGLWEASYAYEDLINQCRLEIFLALLNGFNPHGFIKGVATDDDIIKLEKTIVFGRLESWLRRQTWKYHPDQLGGQSCSFDEIANPNRDTGIDQHSSRKEFRFGLFTKEMDSPIFPIDFIRDQKDRLLDILNREGPEAVKVAFSALDIGSREAIQESLFEQNDWGDAGRFVGE
jgi:hypothetical protein